MAGEIMIQEKLSPILHFLTKLWGKIPSKKGVYLTVLLTNTQAVSGGGKGECPERHLTYCKKSMKEIRIRALRGKRRERNP